MYHYICVMVRTHWHIFILIFIFWGENTFATQSEKSKSISPSDSTVKVLKITQFPRQEVQYLVPGMQVTYWHKSEVSFWKKRLGEGGVLNEVREDTLVINHQYIAFSDITRIKGKNNKFAKGSAKVLAIGALILFLIGIIAIGSTGPYGLIFLGIITGITAAIAGLLMIKPNKIGDGNKVEVVDMPLGLHQKLLAKANSPGKKFGRFLGNLILFGIVGTLVVFLLWFLFESIS